MVPHHAAKQVARETCSTAGAPRGFCSMRMRPEARQFWQPRSADAASGELSAGVSGCAEYTTREFQLTRSVSGSEKKCILWHYLKTVAVTEICHSVGCIVITSERHTIRERGACKPTQEAINQESTAKAEAQRSKPETRREQVQKRLASWCQCPIMGRAQIPLLYRLMQSSRIQCVTICCNSMLAEYRPYPPHERHPAAAAGRRWQRRRSAYQHELTASYRRNLL